MATVFYFDQTLDAARRRLAAAVQERSRVLDLICQALPATTGRNTARTYRTTWGSGRGSRMCASADGYTRSGMPNVDPLGMYTPEADEALKEAKDARDRSAMLRNDLENSIARVDQQQRNTHKSVNNGITQKMAETVNLKVCQFAHRVLMSNKALFSYVSTVSARGPFLYVRI